MINSRNIADLAPAAQVWCRRHVEACRARLPHGVLLVQTRRDAEYQASLFAQGRTTHGPACSCKGRTAAGCTAHPLGLTITNCDGTRNKSRHQSGLAWDLVPLDASGKPDWSNAAAFEVMAQEAEKLGIMAGLRWKMHDSPHFEVQA